MVAQFLESFKDYPPRQKAASFSVDQVMEKLKVGLECRDLRVAREHDPAAVAQLPENSAWHHLGRLYLTLAQL